MNNIYIYIHMCAEKNGALGRHGPCTTVAVAKDCASSSPGAGHRQT